MRKNNSPISGCIIRHASMLFTIVILSTLINCTNQETLNSDQVNSQLFSAASYKARECGDPIPSQFLFAISDNVPQRNVDLCTFAILRSECPFSGFPLVCVLIYLEEAGSIPPPLNFGDFINEKL
ncbi:MAG: hypothetical protein JJT78_14695 [Leptospira sp.]|nr:hypothetical protein [Leptospira sp.]